jgi:hypothetical protein
LVNSLTSIPNIIVPVDNLSNSLNNSRSNPQQLHDIKSDDIYASNLLSNFNINIGAIIVDNTRNDVSRLLNVSRKQNLSLTFSGNLPIIN